MLHRFASNDIYDEPDATRKLETFSMFVAAETNNENVSGFFLSYDEAVNYLFNTYAD